MTLPHEQDADALEISELRAEVEKLKADRARIAVEALSTQEELDTAILQVEEERRQHKATAELWLKEERAHEATLLELKTLKSKVVVGGMPAPGLLCLPERDWNKSEAAVVNVTNQLAYANRQIESAKRLFGEIASRAETVPGGEELHNFTKWISEVVNGFSAKRAEEEADSCGPGSVYCSKFDVNSQIHAPTCRFRRRES